MSTQEILTRLTLLRRDYAHTGSEIDRRMIREYENKFKESLLKDAREGRFKYINGNVIDENVVLGQINAADQSVDAMINTTNGVTFFGPENLNDLDDLKKVQKMSLEYAVGKRGYEVDHYSFSRDTDIQKGHLKPFGGNHTQPEFSASTEKSSSKKRKKTVGSETTKGTKNQTESPINNKKKTSKNDPPPVNNKKNTTNKSSTTGSGPKKKTTVGSEAIDETVIKTSDRANGLIEKVPINKEAVEKATKKMSGEAAEEAAEEMAKKWAKNTEWLPWGLGGAAAVIGVASIADSVMNRQDKLRQRRQERIQEHKLEQKTEASLENRNIGMVAPAGHDGLVQELFGNRIGHTNAWGGKRY